ncbi:tRNA pseudouridine(38-40) synthase TruA [Rhodopirellula sallentina]|uniref:tRNA pseudouridine(38-40) synthase TruA n=1 Tax=Rhodopirellula sallentina TaxID=1263869 RepID=UPI001F01D736|nr:tRNA pseudouridine(38-40) synthase TruA [Rhodopirellula sallentina]
MPTYHLTIAYDGTRYSGWQVQPGQPTVQAELENAVATLLGKKAKLGKNAKKDQSAIDPADAAVRTKAGRVLGSGRTDAGVHAWGQVARCVLPDWRADANAVMRGINSRLPDDITVVDVRETVASFHPIADAVRKRYRYQIQVGGQRDPFAMRTRYRVPWPLDVDLLSAAADKFVGTHDFAAFQAAGSSVASTVRTITRSCWMREHVSASDGQESQAIAARSDAFTGQRWCFDVEGNGFLYNMVRNLVGTMLDVARGHRPLEWIDEVLMSKDRQMAGATAPPQGLFLCCVSYPNEVFLTPSLMFTKT